MIKRFGALVFFLTLLFAFAVPVSADVEVPSGYSILEYIESSGTQYIDTGFKPNQNTRVVMDFQLSSKSSYWGSGLFGASNGGNDDCIFFVLENSSTVFRYYYDGNQEAFPSSLSYNSRYTVDINGNSASLGGFTVTHTASTFSDRYNMTLFAYNMGGTTGHFSNAKVYSCQIYDNGTLIRDYVPVKNTDDVVGLWDKVSGTMYLNAGSGSFSAGPVVEVVPYPEYEVTVNGSYASSSGAGSYVEGATVNISAGTRDGYLFSGWTSDDVTISGASSADASFVMPAKSVTVTANWEAEVPPEPPAPTYTVTVSDSFAATSGSGSYVEGATVSISAGDREGYTFTGWSSSVSLADPSAANTSFVMPAQAVTVMATWEKLPGIDEITGTWTPITSRDLFEGGQDSHSYLMSGNRTDPSSNSGTSYFLERGSYNFGSFEAGTELFFCDSGGYSLTLGTVFEPGKVYHLMASYTGEFFGNFDDFNYQFNFRSVATGEDVDVTVYDTKNYSYVPSSGYDDYYYTEIIFSPSESVVAYNSSDFVFTSQTVLYGSGLNSVTGFVREVQPTASGDSYSSTTSDIANKQEQITQIEEEIFADLELYSSQVDINAATNFPSGMLNAVSFIGSTWTEAFNQLGEFQTIITFPLFLGIALLFIGRASSVIVSGSMRSRKNNDKQGGGDIG